MNTDTDHGKTSHSWWRSPMGLITCLSLAAIGVWAIIEHREHVLSAAPYLLFLACPLMHLFMHHGHGDHSHHHDHPSEENKN